MVCKPAPSVTRLTLTWNPQGKQRHTGQETPGTGIYIQTPRRQTTPGDSWRDQNRTGSSGGPLSVAGVPGGMKGLNK